MRSMTTSINTQQSACSASRAVSNSFGVWTFRLMKRLPRSQDAAELRVTLWLNVVVGPRCSQDQALDRVAVVIDQEDYRL